MVKTLDQQGRDKDRKSYRLAFPSDLDADRVVAWVRSISGTLHAGNLRFTGTPTIAFETWSSNKGITHRIRVPWQHADYIIAQLRSLVPGIRVMPDDDFPKTDWTRAVEVGMTSKSRQLRIVSLADMSASLLASVGALDNGEIVIVQWVVTPAVPTHPPLPDEAQSHELHASHFLKGNKASRDEINDRRAKLAEPNMMAVLRVGAFASTPVRADHLIYRVRSALASARGPSTRFVKRFVSKGMLLRRLQHATGSVVFPVQLSASELGALIAWPIDNPFVAGISPSLSRHLPPSAVIPLTGRILGTANMPGAERDVAVSYGSAIRHTHVLGRTGTGKSTLLANMMAQDMESGHGIILIEGKGDLFEAALDRIPRNRVDDVVILDVNDSARPVGFNIFDQGNSRTSIDELCSLVALLYKDSSASVHAPQVLYHMMHALAEVPGSTFIDLPSMLTPQSPEEATWRDDLIRHIKEPEIKLFMQRYMNMSRSEQDRMSGPVYNRTWQFTSRPEMRYILGQRTSSFKMTDVVRDNKILLVNLNGIRVGQQTASLVGTLLVNAVWQAVRSVKANKANFLYLDEFQDFTNMPVDIESMLAKARSSNLGAILAHQNLTQLRPELRSGVMANTATKVIFRVSSDDARLMTRELSRRVDDTDFTGLPEHDAIALVATDIGSSPPVSITTKPPGKPTGNASRARSLSRSRYGRPIDKVKRELVQRTAPKREEHKRPRISGGGWGS